MFVIAAILVICVASSTPQQRAEAREAMKPLERDLGIAAIILWALLLEGVWAPWFK